MIKYNRTKIIATMGPSTASEDVLREMIEAGVDVCRINFSHGKYDEALEHINRVRDLNEKLNTHVGILADLQGPKLRIGDVENNGVELVAGNEIVITTEPCIGTAKQIYITYEQFPRDVAVGDNVLIDDGKLLLKAIATNGVNQVRCVVQHGGRLSSKKGVNLPNTKISLPSLTEKDKRDLEFALAHDIEWIGLSFVRSAQDIIELKELIKSYKKKARVIAKIEKPEAVKDIDAILAATDALMVARGDLGVELPMEDVPVVQKMLVNKCIACSKPVIVATQMMESMITSATPTRAEINDVANAVMDGADAVMLSGETSVGKYPVLVIEAMQRILAKVEEENWIYHREHAPEPQSTHFITDSICYNSVVMAHHSGAKAIICMSNSGYSAFKISSHRPQAHILVFTDNYALLSTLSLLWGVRGFYYDKYEGTDQTIDDIKTIIKQNEIVVAGDLVINVASMPMRERGRTNMMKLSEVE